MNQSIIFVGVGLLAAVALFMVQSKKRVAAGPRVGPITTQPPVVRQIVAPKDSTPPVPRGGAITVATGSGRPTAPINVLGDPEVNVTATKTEGRTTLSVARGVKAIYIPPTYQFDYQ